MAKGDFHFFQCGHDSNGFYISPIIRIPGAKAKPAPPKRRRVQAPAKRSSK